MWMQVTCFLTIFVWFYASIRKKATTTNDRQKFDQKFVAWYNWRKYSFKKKMQKNNVNESFNESKYIFQWLMVGIKLFYGDMSVYINCFVLCLVFDSVTILCTCKYMCNVCVCVRALRIWINLIISFLFDRNRQNEWKESKIIETKSRVNRPLFSRRCLPCSVYDWNVFYFGFCPYTSILIDWFTKRRVLLIFYAKTKQKTKLNSILASSSVVCVWCVCDVSGWPRTKVYHPKVQTYNYKFNHHK